MSKIIIFLNGEFKPLNESAIAFNDGGFQYGDGLFETIRFQNGNIFSSKKHLRRLRKGLQVLDLHLEQTDESLILTLQQLIAKNQFKSGLLRLMVTRGIIEGTPWNYAGHPCVYISIRPLSPFPESPVKVVFLKEENYPIIRFSPAIKSMNYIGNMKAKKDAEQMGAYEPVFINNENYVTECAIRNIFFIKDDILFTPSLDLGVLPGVMRSTILEIAREIDLPTEESYISYSEINEMKEAFISSTGIGLLPCYWDGWVSDFDLTKKISAELNRRIHTPGK